MMQVRKIFTSDPDHWANTLWEALEIRFTQDKLSQFQTNLITLGKFSKVHDKNFKKMIDRFKKLIADVRSIDAAQMPSDTNLLAITKKLILGFTALCA